MFSQARSFNPKPCRLCNRPLCLPLLLNSTTGSVGLVIINLKLCACTLSFWKTSWIVAHYLSIKYILPFWIIFQILLFRFLTICMPLFLCQLSIVLLDCNELQSIQNSSHLQETSFCSPEGQLCSCYSPNSKSCLSPIWIILNSYLSYIFLYKVCISSLFWVVLKQLVGSMGFCGLSQSPRSPKYINITNKYK